MNWGRKRPLSDSYRKAMSWCMPRFRGQSMARSGDEWRWVPPLHSSKKPWDFEKWVFLEVQTWYDLFVPPKQFWEYTGEKVKRTADLGLPDVWHILVQSNSWWFTNCKFIYIHMILYIYNYHYHHYYHYYYSYYLSIVFGWFQPNHGMDLPFSEKSSNPKSTE